MELTREGCLGKLLQAYSHRYDIAQDVQIGEEVFPAMAEYYLRDENYLISRKHVLSAVENHEYVYFWTPANVEAAQLQRMIELTKADGLGRIHPSKDHMSSMVTLVVLADNIEPEAEQLIKTTRFHKNFRLALHGWMEYQIAAMNLSTMRFLSNPAGKKAKQNLEQNFGSRRKK